MAEMHANLIARLQALTGQYDDLGRQLADPAVMADHERIRALSIKRAAMADLVERYRAYRDLADQMAEHEQIIADAEDAELVELAQAELPALREQAAGLLDAIAHDLVTADDRAVGAVILEVRAGAGGAEAALWAGDVLEMYQRLSGRRGWKFSLLEASPGEQGGLRQAMAGVEGPGVWQGLGYEGGVHCVKRVPATEAQGRVHTSTCTVAVLPEPEAVEVNIPDSDVKIEVTTAQGPGGQNVNKVATAVRMVHLPTGIEVRMQESKSQQQNRARAWQVLRARVFDRLQQQKNAQRAEARSKMIGSGDRSERIRTYRFKENIAVDHRLNESFPLQPLLAGEMDALIDTLIARDRAQRLAAL